MNNTENQIPAVEADKVASGPLPAATPYKQKVRGYVGLFVVLSICGVLLSQESPNRQNFPLKTSYTSTTVLSNIVALNWRTPFVKGPEQIMDFCRRSEEYAKQTYLKTKDEIAQNVQQMRKNCDPLHMFIEGRPALDMLLKADPLYWDKIEAYKAAKENARIAAGLKEGDTPNTTKEMWALVEPLSNTYDIVLNDARNWLHRVNLAAHITVIFTMLFGIWCRRGVGAVLLAPFGWLFSLGKGGIKVAKTVHKNI